MIEAHTDHYKAVRRLILELVKAGVDGTFIHERFGPDVELNIKLIGGRGEYFCILALASPDDEAKSNRPIFVATAKAPAFLRKLRRFSIKGQPDLVQVFWVSIVLAP
ncbi:MAG: hypothetical protein ACYTFW_15200 [Planctomycetota bacterium]